MTKKTLKRRLRKFRNRLAAAFFDTRYGRELLVSAIGPRIRTMTADCGDHLMTFSPNDYIGRKVFRKGHFERDHVDRLLTVLRDMGRLQQGSVLLELGANIGTQTVYFALSKSFRHLLSVEPDPRNFALLSANIRQNGLETGTTLVNCAAGETEGEIAFFLHRDNHGKSSALRQSPNDTKVTVPVRPVSGILEAAGIEPEDVGLVWMDIEGYEPIAARSMETLFRRRTPIYLEFTPLFYGKDKAAAFVAQLAGFYDDCIVFDEEEQTAMKVRDIPIDRDQFDVLLV